MINLSYRTLLIFLFTLDELISVYYGFLITVKSMKKSETKE